MKIRSIIWSQYKPLSKSDYFF